MGTLCVACAALLGVVDPAFKIPTKDLESGGFTCKKKMLLSIFLDDVLF